MRIEAGRGSFSRLTRSTAGPSATARDTAISSSPRTDRTRYSTYSRTPSATSVKKIRAIVRVLSWSCPTTVRGRLYARPAGANVSPAFGGPSAEASGGGGGRRSPRCRLRARSPPPPRRSGRSSGWPAAGSANPSRRRPRRAASRPPSRARRGWPRSSGGSPRGSGRRPSATHLRHRGARVLGLRAGHGLADQLRLLDGQDGRGWQRLLDEAVGEQAADRAEQEQDQRHDEEAEPRPAAGVEQLPYPPRRRMQQVDQPEEGEHGGYGPRNDAADQARDLDGHLGLRERDLLADEELHLLGDLLDRLAEVGGARLSHCA